MRKIYARFAGNAVPHSPMRGWLAWLFWALMLYSVVAMLRDDDTPAWVTAPITAGLALIAIVEFRRWLWWRRNRDYAEASTALAAILANLPTGVALCTESGDFYTCEHRGGPFRRRYVFGRVGEEHAREVYAAADCGAGPVITHADIYTLYVGDHRVTHRVQLDRLWNHHEVEHVGEKLPMLTRLRLSRTGVFDLPTTEVRRIADELRTAVVQDRSA